MACGIANGLQGGNGESTEPEMGNSDNRFGTARKLFPGRPSAFTTFCVLLLMVLGYAQASAEQTNRPSRLKFDSALQSQMQTPPLRKADPTEDTTDYSWRIMAALALSVACALPLLVPRVIRLINERAKASAAAAANSPEALHKAFVESQLVSQIAAQVQSRPEVDPAAVKEAQRDALDEFFKTAPDLLGTLRNLFASISRSPEPSARQKALTSLGADIEALKARLATFELIPAWQVTCGLEKLLEQLLQKPTNITPSTLRTAAGALVLLENLCVKGIRTDLASNPPVRFLAVDDDPISRRAVSMSLKKVAQEPDLAEDGETALEGASRKNYDAIFLDVEMPGLDGFEVCTKIHQFELNRMTPVVFVTSHSDFEARAKSTSSGGRDLIAKPFLSSEITLKALTLLLRGRLEREKAERESAEKESPALIRESLPLPHKKIEKPEISMADTAKQQNADSLPEFSSAANKATSKTSAANASSAPLIPSAQDHAEALATHGLEHLRAMQKQVTELGMADESGREEILGVLYVGLNVLRSEAARAGFKAICELASALGKLISKLLEKPAFFTPSAQQSMSAAIRLLQELAPGSSEPDLSNPAIRALVVDDEPLTRRAISNALQLTFGKPDHAEDGQVAVALTQNKVFDVIFLDIMMPEMDGFETCSKIRESKLNSTTPIIFVTSHNDTESRDKSFNCGGNGFISKPVLPAEIFLTALTFALRSRMGQTGVAVPVEQLEAALC